MNGAVYALNADAPGALYIGGAFTDAGGIAAADNIAKYSGGKWQSLGPSALNGGVFALAYRAGKVYAGGVFTNAGGNPDLDFLAVWDGTKWGPVCNSTGPLVTATVAALQIVGSTLYIGGSFANGAGIASADFLLACDLNTGVASSTVAKDGDFAGSVYALTADSHGTLYAGGGFSNVSGIPAADNIASYSGGVWHALGTGPSPGGGPIDDFVRSLAASGTDVYVGTDSRDVAGIAQADHVARWNGSAWSAVGSNTAGSDGWLPSTAFINAITVSGSRVFVAGSFQNANGDPRADMIASFGAGKWQAVGSDGAGNGPLNGNVTALTNQSGQVYAGGHFTNAGGDQLADSIASFPVSAAAAGGAAGGGGGTTTTTTTSGGTRAATGTATGTVLVNGRPFTTGRIPYGAKIDVTRGSLLLKTDTGTLTVSGRGVSAVFLLLRGTDRKKPIVELRLTSGDFTVCPKRKKSNAERILATTVRQLWGSGKGAFRTRGRYSSSTVRGTIWLTADRCDGTLTKVNRGVIQVSDFPLRKLVTVPAGKSYLAKP